ncbi:GH25 family lysozyme [Novosphingobium capsulatum]|uniref:GH25 family lysozyme n=1 Tax=Novosphingobium capsulatum TaxID=13688 RepID=UPI002E125A16|nr:GH25 family lysozyme [Novosphingobium capsulatum]WQD93711.1 GH25 family lysozyme [Novosphingobium capsulatum]
MSTRRTASCALLGAAFAFTIVSLPEAAKAGPTDAGTLGLTELTDDLSRQQLFEEIQASDRQGAPSDAARAQEAVETFNLTGPFRFPTDTTYDSALGKPRENSYFGVDISHYTSNAFPIEELSKRNVRFLYMKATQGASSLDGKFAYFWKRTGDLPKGKQVHRGAYHFLSACRGADCTSDPAAWGKAQAATFVKVVKANGGLAPTDMPPVVDLEWDKASSSGPDRWANRPAAQIIAVIDAFLKETEAQLHRKPMIYTARSWWNERMGAAAMSPTMKSASLWLADYSRSSRASEVPRSIGDAKWALWQFTDAGTMATGFNGGFDANIYKGALPEFYSSLGVQEFVP